MISKFLRAIFSVVLVFVLIPVIGQVAINVADHLGLYHNPAAVLIPLKAWLDVLTEQSWFWATLIGIFALTCGLWADWIVRTLDSTRNDKLASLGWTFEKLAHEVRQRQQNLHHPWPQNVATMRSDFISAFLTAKNCGLWSPDDRAFRTGDAAFLHSYLHLIGRLLRDSHFKEAKRQSQIAANELDKLVPPN